MDHPLVALIEALRIYRLLEPEQLGELTPDLLTRYAGPDALVEDLVRRDWLTPYQVQQIRDGHGKDLVLEPYLLLRPLGRGGMGQVFLARHRCMHRVVALKVIRQRSRADARLVQRFRREIKAAARLSHPNIVTAFDANEVDGTLFLVMEYVEGVNLAQLVGDVGPLTPAQASDYIRQVCLGLQHVHEQGLVHRDIKPSNLLLASKGSVVKILDLGLALLEPWEPLAETGDHLTPTGFALGTVDYLAPEQALDPGRVDIRADMYSLGCTFYHLLAGQAPFPQGNMFQKWWSHKESEPRSLETLRSDLPPGLAQVVSTLMAKSPGDRYQTPDEAAATLEPFCHGIGAQTREYRGGSSSTILPAEPMLALLAGRGSPPGAMPTSPAGTPRAAEEPTSAGGYVSRGKIALSRGAFDRAIADFDAALRLDPDHAPAYNYRGYARRKMRAYDRAIADFDAALRLEPHNARAYYNRGNAYHARGEYDRAIADFDAALRLEPHYARAFNSRGYAHAIKGEHDRAIADYDAALRLDPGFARAYYNRGFAHHARGQFDRAIADYDAVIRLDPGNIHAFNNRGYAYHAKGLHDRSIADYGEVIRLDPNNAGAYLNRGIAHFARHEFDRAIIDYGEAIRLDPDLARAYYNRGNSHHARGQYDRAIADFDAVIRLEPHNARAHNNRGFAYRKTGEFDRAIADFDAALRLDPHNARAFYNRGHAHHDRGELDRAIADYDAALRLDPNHAQAYNSRGLAHALRREDDRAFADFGAALRLDPGLAKAYSNRADLRARRGEQEQADADRREALRLDPNSPRDGRA